MVMEKLTVALTEYAFENMTFAKSFSSSATQLTENRTSFLYNSRNYDELLYTYIGVRILQEPAGSGERYAGIWIYKMGLPPFISNISVSVSIPLS